MKLLRKKNSIFDLILDSLAFVGGALLILAMLAVSYDVVMRYFLHRPSLWIFEMTEYSLLYMTFLGTAWVLKKERHVRMDLVLNRLNPRSQALANVLTSIVGAIICLVIAGYGAKVTWAYVQYGYHSSSPLKFPQGPILAIIPVGSFLLFIQFLRRAHGYLGQWRVSGNKEREF